MRSKNELSAVYEPRPPKHGNGEKANRRSSLCLGKKFNEIRGLALDLFRKYRLADLDRASNMAGNDTRHTRGCANRDLNRPQAPPDNHLHT